MVQVQARKHHARRSRLMERCASGQRIFFAPDGHPRQQLRFKLIGSQQRGERHDLLPVYGGQLCRDVQPPVVAQHRVTDIHEVWVVRTQLPHQPGDRPEHGS